MTKEQKKRLREIWQHCKTGVAKNKEAKLLYR
jgi:hypothetical protein